MNTRIRFITTSSMIAAIYTVLVFVLAPISFGAIQVRVAEALTILPYFTPAAIPGLTVGCLLANILAGADILDVVFGTLATLLGAVGTYLLRKHKYVAWVPPFLSNTIIIPFVLRYAYMSVDGIPYLMATVGVGELITCGVLGTMLLLVMEKRHMFKRR